MSGAKLNGRTLPVSVFPDVNAVFGTRKEMAWGSVLDFAQTPIAENKEALRLLSFAEFDGGRQLVHVQRVHAVVADHDAGTMPPAEAARLLDEAGIEAVIHTTARHTADAPRWRAFVPLSKPCTVDEYPGHAALLNGVLRGALAGESANAAQIWHFGRVNGVAFESHRVQGATLDESAADLLFAPLPLRVARAEDGGAPHTRLSPPMSDDEVLDRARSARNGAKFTGMFDHGIKRTEDASADDAALAGMLAFWTQDAEQIERLMRQSAMVRDKWERPDYLPRTIESVLSMPGERYAPDAQADADGGPDDPARATEPAFREVRIDDVLTNPPPPRVFVWGTYLPVGVVTLLSAHGDTGKTYVMLMLAVAVALGRDLFGVQTRRGVVCYFSGEDPAEEVRRRVGWICAQWGIDPKSLTGRLLILDAASGAPELYRADRGAGRATPTLHQLERYLAEHEVTLLIIDNSSDAFDGDEVSRQQVRAFMRTLSAAAARLAMATVLLTHVNKEAARTDKLRSGVPSDGYSGSTAWHNSARSRLFMEKTDDGFILRHQKGNYVSRLAQPLRVVWREGALPCVVTPTTPAAAEAGDAARRRALQVLMVRLIAQATAKGDYVSPAHNARTRADKVLSVHKDFPQGLRAQAVLSAVAAAEDAGWLERVEYRRPDRKTAVRWGVTEAGQRAIAEDASLSVAGEADTTAEPALPAPVTTPAGGTA